MGIRGYTKWLRKNFSGCFVPCPRRGMLADRNVRSRAIAAVGRRCARGYDHVHFDLAARLYPCAERASSVEHLLKIWFADLNALLARSGSRKSVTFAIDGVPPAAKLFVQRERRARVPLENGELAWRDERPGGGVDSLNFTVGTRVIAQLRDALAFFCVQAVQSRRFAGVRFLLSGPDVAGEGEHKLHRRILRYLRTPRTAQDSHLIVGNDADLLVQACAASAVVRTPKKRGGVGGGGDSGGDGGAYEQISVLLTYHGEDLLLPMGELARALVRELRGTHVTMVHATRVLLDFAMLSLLMGSDYFPKLRGVGMERSWPAYIDVLRQRRQLDEICGAGTASRGVFITTPVAPTVRTRDGGVWTVAIDRKLLADVIENAVQISPAATSNGVRRGNHDRAKNVGSDGMAHARESGLLSPQQFMGALCWTLGLTMNGVARDQRVTYHPKAAPEPLAFVEWLRRDAGQPHAESTRTATEKNAHVNGTGAEVLHRCGQPLRPLSIGLLTLPAPAVRRLMPPAVVATLDAATPATLDCADTVDRLVRKLEACPGSLSAQDALWLRLGAAGANDGSCSVSGTSQREVVYSRLPTVGVLRSKRGRAWARASFARCVAPRSAQEEGAMDGERDSVYYESVAASLHRSVLPPTPVGMSPLNLKFDVSCLDSESALTIDMPTGWEHVTGSALDGEV